MQQKINSDIQNVNLEHTNQSPPWKKFEIIFQKTFLPLHHQKWVLTVLTI